MPQFTSDSPTIDEIMAVRKPRTEEFWLPLDGDVLAELNDLEQELKRAEADDERLNRPPKAPALREQLEEASRAAEAAAVRFVCRELPRKQYRDLIAAHPSDDPKRRWDDETFGPALIAACYTVPVISPEQALALWEEWSEYATSTLFGAAVMVNEGPSKIPFGVRRFDGTPASEPSSASALPEESLTPSS